MAKMCKVCYAVIFSDPWFKSSSLLWAIISPFSPFFSGYMQAIVSMISWPGWHKRPLRILCMKWREISPGEK
jgi:hypothetical protein